MKNKCNICKQTIIKGEHYYSDSDSYEAAELGHDYDCMNYLWDFDTLGSSSKRKIKEPTLNIPPLTTEEKEERYLKFRL